MMVNVMRKPARRIIAGYNDKSERHLDALRANLCMNFTELMSRVPPNLSAKKAVKQDTRFKVAMIDEYDPCYELVVWVINMIKSIYSISDFLYTQKSLEFEYIIMSMLEHDHRFKLKKFSGPESGIFEERIDFVICFRKGKNSHDVINEAMERGIPVLQVTQSLYSER